jgi:hypothetical protein
VQSSNDRSGVSGALDELKLAKYDTNSFSTKFYNKALTNVFIPMAQRNVANFEL